MNKHTSIAKKIASWLLTLLMLLTISMSGYSTYAHPSSIAAKVKEEKQSEQKNSSQKQTFIKKLEVFSQQADKALVLPAKVIGDFLTPSFISFSILTQISFFKVGNNTFVLHPSLRVVLLFFTAPNAP
jgi:hypothetical protein